MAFSSARQKSVVDPEKGVYVETELPTKRKVVKDLVENLSLGIADVRDFVETFNGRKGDEAHENVLFYLKTYEDLLSLHVNDESLLEVERDFRSKASNWRNELLGLRDALEEKTEGEDRAMKEMNKLMAELEEEVKNYYSDRSTKKYKNIQTRLTVVTRERANLKPSCSHNVKILDDINKRLAELWKDFEDRSESVVDMLAKNMVGRGGSNGRNDRERNLNVREEAIKKYEKEMIEFVKMCLGGYQDKFRSGDDLNKFAVDVVRNKILGQEVNQWSKKVERERGLSWAEFRVSGPSKKNVEDYLKKKMNSRK